MLSAIQTTSKETTLQEHAAAEHGSAHDIPAESPKFRHPHKVMLGLYIGAFLGMLSETSMNIALPDLMDEFSVPSGTAQWMVVGYMLAVGVALAHALAGYPGALLLVSHDEGFLECAASIRWTLHSDALGGAQLTVS